MYYPDLFEMCMPVIFEHEGGYVNNISDYGGETNFGIAKRFFPQIDIKNLTQEEAKRIYFESYWQPMRLEGILDPDRALNIFDMGVNAGKRNAIRMAQRVVNVKPDGVIGLISTKAINNYDKFLLDYRNKRIEYYIRIAGKRNNQVFLKGWLNRVSSTHF